MSWKNLLLGSVTLALMLEPTACGLYTSGLEQAGGAGGSGGAASSSAQSSQSASTTSSSSGSGPELCFNNMDDDGNTQIDCADPACNGVAQCADVPAGWSPIWVTEGADPMMPPGTCADGQTARSIYFTQPAGLPTCAACQCTVGAGAACSAPEITCYYGSTDCTGAVGTTQQASNNTCIPLSTGIAPGDGSCKLSAAGKVLNPACDVNGGAEMDTPMWGGAVLVCGAPSSAGGCVNGQSCIPLGPSPDGKLCIQKDGTDPCPAPWTTEISGFSGGTDNRKCNGCACTLGCTGGSYVLRDHNNCDNTGDPPVTINAAIGACVMVPKNFDNGQSGLEPTLAAPAVSSCNAQPQGQVDPTGQVQICCK